MAGSNEQALQNKIRLALSNGTVRLFRNNTGALKDERGRLVRFGLAPGSSDLIGWKTVRITSEMVGEKIAVFCAVEIKDKGRATEQQRRFLSVVESAGGLAGVARSIEQAASILGS